MKTIFVTSSLWRSLHRWWMWIRSGNGISYRRKKRTFIFAEQWTHVLPYRVQWESTPDPTNFPEFSACYCMDQLHCDYFWLGHLYLRKINNKGPKTGAVTTQHVIGIFWKMRSFQNSSSMDALLEQHYNTFVHPLTVDVRFINCFNVILLRIALSFLHFSHVGLYIHLT